MIAGSVCISAHCMSRPSATRYERINWDWTCCLSEMEDRSSQISFILLSSDTAFLTHSIKRYSFGTRLTVTASGLTVKLLAFLLVLFAVEKFVAQGDHEYLVFLVNLAQIVLTVESRVRHQLSTVVCVCFELLKFRLACTDYD